MPHNSGVTGVYRSRTGVTSRCWARSAAHLVCAWLLLFAQQGALEHAVSHLGHDAPLSVADHVDNGALGSDACDLHALFCQVLTTASVFPAAFAVQIAVSPAAIELPDSLCQPEEPAPRSRGPPVLS